MASWAPDAQIAGRRNEHPSNVLSHNQGGELSSASPPLTLRHPQTVLVAYTVRDIDAAIVLLRSSGHTLVGLDCEWRPSFHVGQARARTAAAGPLLVRCRPAGPLPPSSAPPTVCSVFPPLGLGTAPPRTIPSSTPEQPRYPVALIQLAVPGLAVLAHVASSRALGRELTALLQDPSIAKVGCSVEADAEYLFEDFGVDTRGCVDLTRVAERIGYPRPGLAGICAAFGIALPKSKKVQMSNWAWAPLTPLQQEYAALDAAASLWAALQLWHHHHARGGAVPAAAHRHDAALLIADLAAAAAPAAAAVPLQPLPPTGAAAAPELEAERSRVLAAEAQCAEWLRGVQVSGGARR